MAQSTPHEHGMTPEQARKRLDELRRKEKEGSLTVGEAGEITRLLVILGESGTGEKAA